MPNNDWVEISTLTEFTSLEVFLKEVIKASGQSIKAQGFDKRWLNAPLRARQSVRLPLQLLNRFEIWPSFTGPAPRLLSEDNEFVALHKPAEVHTHPVGYEATPNLLSWLVTQGRHDLLRVNPTGPDRGCLYRLDGATSGLVLYAKTTEIYQEVRAHFNTLFHEKTYLCIVTGCPGEQQHVEHFLSPFGPKGAQMKVGHAGERAVLGFRTLQTSGDYSLVEVALKTGLRHQIRVQLAALGFPILGDELYGGAKAARMFLHCYRYKMNWRERELLWSDREAELFDGFFNLDRLL